MKSRLFFSFLVLDTIKNTTMTIFNLPLIVLICLIIIISLLAKYVLNEKQIHQLKYTLYAVIVMFLSVITIPIFLIRPRNAINIRVAALLLNPLFYLFGLKYRIENANVFDKVESCVIVANHQSSIDFIGMMKIWPDYIRYCTILAKKELIWVLPFGLTAWLAGVEYVDRKNRERSSKTMKILAKKLQDKSLRLWIFPEGIFCFSVNKNFSIYF